MKKYLAFLTAVVFIASSSAQNQSFVSFYEDGTTKKAEGQFLEGKQEGVWKTWHANGSLESTAMYNQGILNGDEVFYMETEKEQFTHYKWGKKDSIYQEWYPDGKERLVGYYTYNLQDSIWTYWYRNGQPKKVENRNEGEIILIHLWDKFGDQLVSDGEGMLRYFHANGNLMEETPIAGGLRNGLSKRYYEDGQLRSEGTYKNGLFQGKWSFYRADGTLSKNPNL